MSDSSDSSDAPRKILTLPVAQVENKVSFARKPLRSGASRNKNKVTKVAPPELPVASAERQAWSTQRADKRQPPSRFSQQERPEQRKRPANSTERTRGDSSSRSSTGSPHFSPAKERTSNASIAAIPLAETSGEVRISKLMAERGLCSRREADAYIERGWVYVDGVRVTVLGTRALPSAVISLDKAAQAQQYRLVTILINKPVGYVSGQPEPGHTPAVTLVLPENQLEMPDTAIFHASFLKGLAPAGRLDVDSTGLLVMTQDGRIARQLVGERSTIDKEYLVRVEGNLSDEGLALLRHGLELDDRPLRPAQVEWANDDQLRFILNEGRKRQIRRMCEAVGLRVIGLKRVRIGKIMLGNLPLGQWRTLREDEVF